MDVSLCGGWTCCTCAGQLCKLQSKQPKMIIWFLLLISPQHLWRTKGTDRVLSIRLEISWKCIAFRLSLTYVLPVWKERGDQAWKSFEGQMHLVVHNSSDGACDEVSLVSLEVVRWRHLFFLFQIVAIIPKVLGDNASYNWSWNLMGVNCVVWGASLGCSVIQLGEAACNKEPWRKYSCSDRACCQNNKAETV